MNLYYTVADIICVSLLLVIFILFIWVWPYLTDKLKRVSKDKKIFYDINRIRPSDDYMKTMEKFIDLFKDLLYKAETNEEITSKEIQILDDLYQKVFIKGVNTILITDPTFEPKKISKQMIDEDFKYIKSRYKSWEKFNKANEI